jgi:hypothetical protein
MYYVGFNNVNLYCNILSIHKTLTRWCSNIFFLEAGNSDACRLHVFTIPSPHQFSLPANYSINIT